MQFINPHKTKYYNYYMRLAIEASKESVAKRRQVGAIIVLPTGLIASGWNGQPPGFNNECEYKCNGKTKPSVIHAERNALDKLAIEGISPKNSILFVTVAPCMDCAKSIANVGITKIFYLHNYSCKSGIDYLQQRQVDVYDFNEWKLDEPN